MSLLRFGIIAGAHLVVFGIIYLMSGFGGGSREDGIATAGANGITSWSNKESNADAQTVTSSGFDSSASDLAGYNAEDADFLAQTQVPTISSRELHEPTRPSGSSRTAGPG